MQDIFAVADRVIVMRRGKKVGERMANATTTDELVSLMVGSATAEEESPVA
jgi:simple sugar transport system ATP-binding protein